ncbi:MAG: dTDP-glucose 4,6-dehydratase [Candidatus Omnitrophica bacterium]|nr:dTDP-glucose 4,6-dehydratase [Candidatus Omnitrophota bacterium]
MRILVTGGAGFIGSHFIRAWLKAHPADTVVNLDALTYAGSSERLADVDERRHALLHGDICDGAIVEQAIAGCELLVHCAAETHVDRSITNAAKFLRTNIEGTRVLLEAARAAGVKRVIHISTDEVYGPVLNGAVEETAPLAPKSPYAASKAAGDLLAQSYYATYGLPVIVVRPTNCYGPGQFPEKLIPLAITNVLDGRSVPVYGDGQQRRAWLFVTDACAAIQAVIERGALGEVYNVAGESEQPNLQTVGMILELLRASASLIEHVADRPGHDRRYAMRDDRLRALEWQPRVTFADGLARTTAWYRTQEMWWRPLVRQLREDSYHWLNRSAGPSPHQAARSAP